MTLQERGRTGRGSAHERGRGGRYMNKKTEKLYKFHPQGDKIPGNKLATFTTVHDRMVSEI